MVEDKKIAEVNLISSEKNWVEGEALEQLKNTVKLPGIFMGTGMPDIHPGKGNPIGAVFGSKNIIYPYLLGNDVGCGMGLWQTELKSNKIKRDQWVKKLSGLELPWDGDVKEALSEAELESGDFDYSLGTIGGGNHFAELQKIERVEDKAAFEELGLNKSKLMLLIHSGSRGLGESLLRAHVDQYKDAGLVADSEEMLSYIKKHDYAIEWARLNRVLIAERFFSSLGTRGDRILDLCHNGVSHRKIDDEFCWLHRKGATPSDEGPAIIPGSRGSFSYLVVATGNQRENAYSLPHGAGRKWKRGDCKKRLESRFKPDALQQTELGSSVICEDKNLLYEEAPQAYKNIDVIINGLKEAGLIKVIAILRPIITYKNRKK